MGLNEVVVVSGLPRSGTSMMMQALRAGGLAVLTDGSRVADDDNPEGYLELEAVKGLSRGEVGFLDGAENHAVKVIHALLKHLPATHRYRVIFMMRDLSQVVASQRKMLERHGRAGAVLPDEKLIAIFDQKRREALAWLHAQPHIQTLPVEYTRTLAEPGETMNQINAFLGGGLDPQAMCASVDPSLHRQKPAAE